MLVWGGECGMLCWVNPVRWGGHAMIYNMVNPICIDEILEA